MSIAARYCPFLNAEPGKSYDPRESAARCNALRVLSLTCPRFQILQAGLNPFACSQDTSFDRVMELCIRVWEPSSYQLSPET